MLKYMFVAVCALGLTACASTQSVMPRVDIVDRPELGGLAQAELGDTIVEKGKITTYDGLALKNEVTWGDGFILKKFTISPGRLRARQSDSSFTYYYSDKMTTYDAILGTSPYAAGGLCVKKNDPSYVRGFFQTGKCKNNFKPAPEVSVTRVIDLDAPNFRQELIYNGKSDNTLKFLYREFSGDYARPSFSQDVQYDLKDGNTIGFKGVRIEVVEASNTRLSYRLISSFPDPRN
ncbi:hypothetical protein [Caulobacter segnis]|uniref:hypothetical protein n=1 Tax=Caulobacter segnis TaxID=88688 RepID=UPI001CBCE128|nr:hypothetical protein [Caulobacter segnis]UAL11226.1 hypothetical protein K8940_02685 [Caulobacter segnis]